jgi:transcription antitermination factor NusG
MTSLQLEVIKTIDSYVDLYIRFFMKPTAQWYAVYTKPRWEKKVAMLLSQKGMENYCPTNRVLKQWHDRKKWVEEPLFTSYVFVRLSPGEGVEVRKTAGVINFVYWLSKPALVKEEEITAIKDFLGRHNDVRLEKSRVQVEDTVRIMDGPLIEKEGTVVAIHHNTIKVLLPGLGYALVAQVEKLNEDVGQRQRTGKSVADLQ